MGEISKVYLYSKAPLTPQQEEESLRDIQSQAVQGFRVELQREVLAHTSEETFMFTVRRIDPVSKFYGLVDGDTVFELMRDEAKPPPPMEEAPCAVRAPEAFPLPRDIASIKSFIDEMEALRLKYDVSWSCLRWIVVAVDEFEGERAPRL